MKSANAPGWIRTNDRRIRNPMLYPAELRARPGFDVYFVPDSGCFSSPGRTLCSCGDWQPPGRCRFAQRCWRLLPHGSGKREVTGDAAGPPAISLCREVGAVHSTVPAYAGPSQDPHSASGNMLPEKSQDISRFYLPSSTVEVYLHLQNADECPSASAIGMTPCCGKCPKIKGLRAAGRTGKIRIRVSRPSCSTMSEAW